MSTSQNPQDPAGAETEKRGTGGSSEEVEGRNARHGLSEQTQKALIAVTSGLALILSVIALVVAIVGTDGHHGRGDGPMHGGPRMEMNGGPMHGGPQGGPPPGAYPGQGPGSQGGPQGGDRQDDGNTSTTPGRDQ